MPRRPDRFAARNLAASRAARLRFPLVLFFFALAFLICLPTIGLAQGWRDKVEFLDSAIWEDTWERLVVKPWKDDERRLILDHLQLIAASLPGLFERASLYGPLKLHRTPGNEEFRAMAGERAIYLTDDVFDGKAYTTWTEAGERRELPGSLVTLLHEMVHMADKGYRLAAGAEWRRLAEPRIRDFRGAGIAWNHPDSLKIARQVGFPRGYASTDLAEALADSGAFVAAGTLYGGELGRRLAVPRDIAAFVEQRLLSRPTGPDAAMLAYRKAQEISRSPGSRDAVLTGLAEAIRLDPSLVQAYFARASTLAGRKETATAAVEDATKAIALASVYDKRIGRLYALRIDARISEGGFTQAEAVADDCLAALKFGRKEGKLYFDCGRAKMFRAGRLRVDDKMTVEEARRVYAEAALDFQQALRLAPWKKEEIQSWLDRAERWSKPPTPDDENLKKGIDAYDRGDYATALALLRPIAERGRPDAEFAIAVMYGTGQGLARDDAEAAKWMRRAADKGHAEAQAILAHMHAIGRGVPQDAAEAVRLARESARKGHPRGQAILGSLYAAGRGVPVDLVQAYLWLTLAAARGDEEAAKNLALVGAKMSAEDKAKAERFALAWTYQQLGMRR
jgi:tetratricopeptide (TPR) repeat protein